MRAQHLGMTLDGYTCACVSTWMGRVAVRKGSRADGVKVNWGLSR